MIGKYNFGQRCTAVPGLKGTGVSVGRASALERRDGEGAGSCRQKMGKERVVADRRWGRSG